MGSSVAVPGPAGAKGDSGSAGAPGVNGKDGANGVSGYEVSTYDYFKGPDYPGAGNSSIATAACSPGKVAVGGGYFIRNGSDDSAPYGSPGWAFNSPALGQGVGAIASFPGRMDWSTNTVRPGRHDGWIVQFNGNGPALDVTVYAICINAA